MSTPPQSRGRGRGRGKDLTSSERVAQWVNQREAKRLTKERWASQGTRSSSPSVVSKTDGQVSDKITPESDSSSERSKATHNVQLYIPPFLRNKKSINVDVHTEHSFCTNEGIPDQTSNDLISSINDVTNCNDIKVLPQENELSNSKEVTVCIVDTSKRPVERSRAKGRGKRKPEVEIYIPRALRATKNDSKLSVESCIDNNSQLSAVVEIEKCNVDTKISEQRRSLSETQSNSEASETAISNPLILYTNDLTVNKITSEMSNSSGFILDSDNPAHQTSTNSEITNSNSIILDNSISEIPDTNPVLKESDFSNQISIDTEKFAFQELMPEYLPSQTGDNVDLKCPLSLTVPVISDGGELKNNIESTCEVLMEKGSQFTFEFYDPAVIAFLPSPPIQHYGEADVTPYFSQTPENFSINDEISKQERITDFHVPSNKISPLSKPEGKNLSEKCSNCVFPRMSEEICLDGVKDDKSKNIYDNQVIDKGSHVNEAENISSNNTDIKSNSNVTDVETSSPTSDKLTSKKHKTKKKAKEGSSSKSKESKSKKEGAKKKVVQDANVEKVKKAKENISSEETVDSWDALYDENGDCLDDSMLQELTEYVGKVEIDKPKINYLKYEPKEPSLDFQAFSHIVEIFEFPPEFTTADLIGAFRDFASRGFDVKWVDDTHALGVFSSTVAANEALKMIHPLLKVRPMSEASKKGQAKARVCQEFLQPYKARPETTSLAARRLVAGALGMAPRVSREARDQEKQKLKEAKEKRRQERQQKNDAWDGAIGQSVMDELDSGLS